MVCPTCQFENLSESTFCTSCGYRFEQKPRSREQGPYGRPKYPWVAAVISVFIPGFGHIYAGKWKTGVLWHLGLVGLGAAGLFLVGHSVTGILGLVFFGLELFVAADAYLAACRKEGKEVSLAKLRELYINLGICLAILFGGTTFALFQHLGSVSIEYVFRGAGPVAQHYASPYRNSYILPRDDVQIGDMIFLKRQAYRFQIPRIGDIAAHQNRFRLEEEPRAHYIVMQGGVGEVVAVSDNTVTLRSFLMKSDGSRRELSQTVQVSQITGKAFMVYYPISRRRWLGR